MTISGFLWGKNMENNFDFISEKVVKKKKTKKQVLKEVAFFCVQALSFGVLAAVMFAFIEPRMDKLINGEPDPVIELYVESSTDKDATSSTENTTTTGEVSDEDDEKNDLKRDRLLTKSVKARILKSSVVISGTVYASEEGGENKEIDTSGVIIHSGKVTLVLTDYESVKECSDIKVEFYGGIESEGSVLKTDKDLGVAVLRVDTQDVFPEKYDAKEIVFGVNTPMNEEDKYIFCGVSKGIGSLFTTCSVLSSDSMKYSGDNVLGIYAIDIDKNVGQNGFIYNNKAQLVGVITQSEKKNIPNLVTAFSARDIKGRVEKMANGVNTPYIGIKGITVNDVNKELFDEDISSGVYVSEVANNSPAYNAGVLRGDVLIQLENTKIHTAKEYSYAVDSLNVGNKITIKVMRKGLEGYKEISYDIVVANKPQ